MPFASPMKLLVIDQSTFADHFMTQVLSQNKYQVIVINSSPEAIDTTRSMNPDVIIINLIQPDTNSWALCSKVREHYQAPILVLSVVSDPNSIAHWLDAGADDFLVKPITTDFLIAQLNKLTRRTLL